MLERDKEYRCAVPKNDGVNTMDEEQKSYPFSEGTTLALRSYCNSVRRGCDSFEVDNLPWPDDTKDFVATLRKAGITSFVVTDKSTRLMDGIYDLAACGCRMTGLRTVARANIGEYDLARLLPELAKGHGIEFRID